MSQENVEIVRRAFEAAGKARAGSADPSEAGSIQNTEMTNRLRALGRRLLSWGQRDFEKRSTRVRYSTGGSWAIEELDEFLAAGDDAGRLSDTSSLQGSNSSGIPVEGNWAALVKLRAGPDGQHPVLPQPGRCPRSRRAAAVGDVAGEHTSHGGSPTDSRRRTSMRFDGTSTPTSSGTRTLRSLRQACIAVSTPSPNSARQFRSEFAELRYGGFYEFSDGQGDPLLPYLRRSEALEAAGLRE